MSLVSLPRSNQSALTDAQQYRVLLAATFVVFLAAVVIRRLGRLVRGRSIGSKSLVAEALCVGHGALAFAFMG